MGVAALRPTRKAPTNTSATSAGTTTASVTINVDSAFAELLRLTAPTSRPPGTPTPATRTSPPAMRVSSGDVAAAADAGSGGAPAVDLTTTPDASTFQTRTGSSRSGSSRVGPPGSRASWVSSVVRRVADDVRRALVTRASTAAHSTSISAATVTVVIAAVRSA